MHRIWRPLVAAILALSAVLYGNSRALSLTVLEPLIEQATGIHRTVAPDLQARAVERAIQIQTDFSHCCLAVGEGEIIAWVRFYDDPYAQLVKAWMGSPEHHAILVDPDYTEIGCGTAVDSQQRLYGVCLFRVTGGSIQSGTPPPPIPDLPNTALEYP